MFEACDLLVGQWLMRGLSLHLATQNLTQQPLDLQPTRPVTRFGAFSKR